MRLPKVSRANALTAAGLLVLLVAVAATAPRWTRLLSRGAPEEEEGRPAREEEGAKPVERQINVKLFFQSKQKPGLVIEERTVAFSDDLAAQLRSVVEEIAKGPTRDALVATLPPETKVLEVFVTARGVAYVDLSKEAAAPGRGSTDELMAVYSVVNSLTVNFPAVKRVQILVDDRPAETLGGHVDLARPLVANMTLLAPSQVTPAASPAAPEPSR